MRKTHGGLEVPQAPRPNQNGRGQKATAAALRDSCSYSCTEKAQGLALALDSRVAGGLFSLTPPCPRCGVIRVAVLPPCLASLLNSLGL